MTLETLKQAGSGWSKILGSRPDWEAHFRLDAEGMNAGFLAFGAAVLAAIVLATLRFGFPPPLAMALVVIQHLLPLLALFIATGLLTRFTAFAGSSARFVVPGLYLLAVMKLVEGLATLLGVPLAGAILAVTGFLGFRLARANGLTLAPAVGYGLALFVLLAVLPIALYMLVNAF
jgi:hypothetical protein|tara:strand:- start:6441 stop:6965 length:525 start_codon:yes stop_codon:yes gene_type:complete